MRPSTHEDSSEAIAGSITRVTKGDGVNEDIDD
jgi:hypothetical protein